MSAFDAAMATLLADSNMGSDAEWQAAAGGTWQPARVLLSTPAELVPGLGATSGRAIAIQATIRAADLAQPPRRGDLLRLAAATYRVETVEPDPLGLTCRLGLARIS
ncbi:hypothetical protein [Rhodovarius sp.]|uniref:head-tail joining protein n=1 Tax=Rhodovarius sp. TaxID=2972673 RepID=UPI003341A3FE